MRKVTIKARDDEQDIIQFCNDEYASNLKYYDLSDEKEFKQCTFTWNWEFMTQKKYCNIGPFPNKDTEDCGEI